MWYIYVHVGVGITFDLSEVTDIVESRMLSHQTDYISIYSNSWGPLDTGFVVAGPGKYTEAVLQLGATEVGLSYNDFFHTLLWFSSLQGTWWPGQYLHICRW